MTTVSVILLIQIVIFLLLFIRLITTNHWTFGKKMLVLLTGALLWQSAFIFFFNVAASHATMYILSELPLLVTTGFMAFSFYVKNQ